MPLIPMHPLLCTAATVQHSTAQHSAAQHLQHGLDELQRDPQLPVLISCR